jgi:uncharacterized protein YukJ
VDDQERWRIAVNVKSQLAPSELQYLIVPQFRHSVTDLLEPLDAGWHPLPPVPAGMALDYIRGNLLHFADMTPLPFSVPGPDNDLNERIDHYIQRAMTDDEAWLYAFGAPWGPESVRDKIFGFSPGRGVHDIHMNQGNTGSFVKDDGVWQDGGLLLRFPGQNQWVAVFLKFQSQATHTDDTTGHRLTDVPTPRPAPAPSPQPAPELPDGRVRILAAQVNTLSSPEDETVILLNTSPQPVDLAGWHLADARKHRKALAGILAPGEPAVVHVRPEVELSNKGGIISLLDAQGLKVHGVSYTREQAKEPGWTLVF